MMVGFKRINMEAVMKEHWKQEDHSLGSVPALIV